MNWTVVAISYRLGIVDLLHTSVSNGSSCMVYLRLQLLRLVLVIFEHFQNTLTAMKFQVEFFQPVWFYLRHLFLLSLLEVDYWSFVHLPLEVGDQSFLRTWYSSWLKLGSHLRRSVSNLRFDLDPVRLRCWCLRHLVSILRGGLSEQGPDVVSSLLNKI